MPPDTRQGPAHATPGPDKTAEQDDRGQGTSTVGQVGRDSSLAERVKALLAQGHGAAEAVERARANGERGQGVSTEGTTPRALRRRPTEYIEGKPVWPPSSSPMPVARQFTDLLHHDGTLRQWRGGWMAWQPSGQWVEIEQGAVTAELYKALEHAVYAVEVQREGETHIIGVPWQPNRRSVGDALHALGAITLLLGTTEPPAWLDGAGDLPAREMVAVANGLLHVTSRQLHPPNPKFFTRVAVPFAYKPEATAKKWLAFLDELWPGDTEAIAVLQEFFGYVLSGRTDLQKMLLLVGPTRGGKGVITRVLSALVGKGNVAAPTTTSLGTNFGLSPLLGKSLAILSDARAGSGPNQVVVERLLTISGEDALTVDRKYREPWTGKIPARFILVSNEVPNFGDASGAIVGRFVVLQTTRSWLDREDRELEERLHRELPGILSWALDGLERLTVNGGWFTQPQSSQQAISTLRAAASPMQMFLAESCELGPDLEVPKADLYEEWRDWCEQTGREKPGSASTFGRHLHAALPGLGEARPGDGEERPRLYTGVALRHSERYRRWMTRRT